MHLKITYEMTEKMAREAVKRAGGNPEDAEDVKMCVDASRRTVRVVERQAEEHIAEMWTSGYRVVKCAIGKVASGNPNNRKPAW